MDTKQESYWDFDTRRRKWYWDQGTRERIYICSRCGNDVPYEELPLYEETAMCSYCCRIVTNDD